MEKAKKTFAEELVQVRFFVERCQNQTVQLETSELLQQVEAIYRSSGTTGKAWGLLREIKLRTARARAEDALANARRKAARVEPDSTSDYEEASRALAEAEEAMAKVDTEERYKLSFLNTVYHEAAQASRFFDLVIASAQRFNAFARKFQKSNGHGNGNGHHVPEKPKGSAEALKEQEQCLGKMGFEWQADTASKRAGGKQRR